MAIYIRRSTDEENQPYSLEAQETRLRAFADSQPGEWTIVAVYPDDGSGATTDRDKLQKMLRAARAGLFDTLLVYRVDRLSRRLRDLVAILDELEDANVTFRSATEPFDTSNPAGRLFVQMLGSFAEFEREVIIDRVIAGMERKAAKGRWTGGTRPYGYVVDKAADKLAILELEAVTVRLVFDNYTRDRLGTQAIATLLNEQGLRTRAGKPWSQRAVEVMVTNRVYIGETRFRDITAADAHEPILDKEQFDLAQRILAKRSAEVGRRAANPSQYTLTGKIRCPDCGRKYIGTVAHGRYNRYRYYVCWTRDRYGTKTGCAIHRFSADELEAAVSDALLDFYTTQHDVINEAVADAEAAHARATSGHRDQLSVITRDLKENTSATDRYLAAFERGTLDDKDETIQNRLSALKEQAKRLRARKAQLEFELDQPPTAPSPGDLVKISEHIREVLTRGTPAARKALFESLIDEIEVHSDDTVTPRFRIPMLGKDEGLGLQGPALTETRTDDAVRALPPLVERRGLEPAGGADDSAPGTDVDDRLNRVRSCVAVPVGRAALVSAGNEVDAAHLPTAAGRLGDLIRGMAAAAASAGEHCRADLEWGADVTPDAADEQLAGPVTRLPRQRASRSRGHGRHPDGAMGLWPSPLIKSIDERRSLSPVPDDQLIAETDQQQHGESMSRTDPAHSAGNPDAHAGSASELDVGGPLARLVSRLAGVVDPVVLAKAVEIKVDVVPRTADDPFGDLIRGMVAAAVRASENLRADRDGESGSHPGTAADQATGPRARVSRPRKAPLAQPSNRPKRRAKRRHPGVADRP